MAEMPSPEFIPPAAMPRFGRAAFQGSVEPHSTPVSDRRIGDPAPFGPPNPFPLVPVSPTAFSAGNRRRLGVVGMLWEWWVFRTRMSGNIFVADSAQFHRIAARRMARPRRLDKVVANKNVVYTAPSYGEEMGSTSESGLPIFSRSRRRR